MSPTFETSFLATPSPAIVICHEDRRGRGHVNDGATMKTFVILAVILYLPVFNPNVEAGPGRIVSRHPYDDGIMPDYPAGQVAARNRMRADDDDGVPTADYVEDDGVDDRADAAPEKSAARPRGGARDSSAELAADGPGPVVGGIQPLTDFIVSLLETVQLTSRATLKKSRNKLQAAARAGAPVEPLARATTGSKADKF